MDSGRYRKKTLNASVPLGLILSLPLWGAVLFPAEQYTAAYWLPEAAVLLAAGAHFLFRHPTASLNKHELYGAALILWCVLVDFFHSSPDTGHIIWWGCLLLLFGYVYRQHMDKKVLYGIFSLLTAVIAAHLVFFRWGIAGLELFGNPAGYAAALAVGWPFLIGLLKECARQWHEKAMVCLLVCLVAYAFVLTDSRSGWFALTLSLLWLSRCLFFPNRRIRRRHVVFLACLLACLLVALYYLRRDSANGRLFIYRITLECIADAPVTGHGHSGFLRTYMTEQANFFRTHPGHTFGKLADNVSYPFNGILDILVHYGVVGLAAVIGLAGSTVRHASRNLLPKNALLYAILTSSWVAAAGMSLFSYPFSFPYISLSMVATLAFSLGYGQENAGSVPTRLVVMALLVAGSYHIVRRVRCETLWRDGLALISEGKVSEGLERLHRIRNGMRKRPDFLYSYAAELNQAGEYRKSDRQLASLRLLLNDYDTELLAADNALCTGRNSRARLHLQRAHEMIPARFMPLYGMLLSYIHEKDSLNAHKTAVRILRQPVKIPSQTIREIKREAQIQITE